MWLVVTFLRDFHSLYLSLCVKETKFEYEVHQNIQEERQNQLRWYVQNLWIYSPWENSHLKGRGCSSAILKRAPNRYQNLVLWAWLGIFPLNNTLNNTLSPVIFFELNPVKGITQAPAVALLSLHTL